MDIQIPDSLLRKFITTKATPADIAEKLSLCGPTVDRLEKTTNDWIYHIEIISNRVDTACAFGIAREVHAVLTQSSIACDLHNNPYKQTINQLGKIPENKPVTVTIDDPSLAPHFACMAVSDVTISSSPKETQYILEACGERSLNSIIDITNELTITYGQPVHVFDYDLIHKHSMHVRESKKGETIQTLDGKTHTLPGGDIVIEDGDGRLIDLCGIMGGALSAVSNSTKNILLFVQTYDPKRIRRTSLALQKRTFAAQLFEKRPDTENVLPVLIEGIKTILERAGGHISSALIDIQEQAYTPKTIEVPLSWFSQFAGIEIPVDKIKNILETLGFTVIQNDTDILMCHVPSWRQWDCAIKEDIAEEIMRIYGYGKLPCILPLTHTVQTTKDNVLTIESLIKNRCVELGYTELFNSALVSSTIAQYSKIDQSTMFILQNPLSDEYTHMRTTLIPSLAQCAQENLHIITEPIKIFEIAHIYCKDPSKHPLADEKPTLALLATQTTFAHMKGCIETLLHTMHIKPTYTLLQNQNGVFDPNRSVSIMANDSSCIGTIGRPSHDLCAGMHLTNDTWIAELSVMALADHGSKIHSFVPLPIHQAVIEDLTFTIPSKTPLGPVMESIKQSDDIISDVCLKNLYNQNYTFTIYYRSPNRTLTGEDITPVRKHIVERLESTHSCVLVGTLQ